MSGLELLGAIASSIALVQAVKGTLKAVDFLRQNSDMKRECNNLRKEILMIECFIMQAQQQTDPTMLSQRLLGSTGHPLVSLAVEELEEILNELNEIVGKYSHSHKAHDPKHYTDKMKWFSEASKVEELRERAQAIKSNLHMAITFRISSMVDRGNMRQEVLFHRVTQQLTYYTHESQPANQALPNTPEASGLTPVGSRGAPQLCDQEPREHDVVHSSSPAKTDTEGQSMSFTTLTRKEEAFMSVTTIQSMGLRTCSIGCQCHCHRNKREYNSGAWAKSLLGSWLVRYEFSGNTCQCRYGSNTGVKLEYQLPKWLWAGVVSIDVCQDPRLSVSLRPCRVLPTGYNVFTMIPHPSVLQEHIRKGHKYFPDDINQSGQSLLQYAAQKNSWEAVRILLRLWENLLSHQGLPRAVGYELKRKYDTSEQQLDSMEFILERVLSYIPDWDEVYESDIHREAMDPEGTGEGMLKALQEQPWAIDELDDHGFPAIHYAVSEGNLVTLDLLIMAKANINQQCYLGLTPLIVSSILGYERETARLLESEECRMNVNHMTPGGFGALHFAIQQNFPTIVHMLLEAGATVTYGAQHEPILHTFSHYIKGSQDAADEILHVLLMHGADLEEKDTAGVTPVMSAIIGKNILALRSLLSAGASLTAIGLDNQNIFHIAAGVPDVKMIDFIGKQNLAGVELEQRATGEGTGSPLHTLHQIWNRPSWQIDEWFPRPSLTDMDAFIRFYFDLLIPDLGRHMSTIDDLLRAVKDRDVSTATGILDELTEKRFKCRQPDLVGWYRGLKGYVIDGGWEYLEEVLKEEHDETNEKIGRAAVAKGKTITDPEMEEFFLK